MPEWESGASRGGAESLCGMQLCVEGIADIESRHSFDYAGFLAVRGGPVLILVRGFDACKEISSMIK